MEPLQAFLSKSSTRLIELYMSLLGMARQTVIASVSIWTLTLRLKFPLGVKISTVRSVPLNFPAFQDSVVLMALLRSIGEGKAEAGGGIHGSQYDAKHHSEVIWKVGNQVF